MIGRYNRTQVLKAFLALLSGLMCSYLAYLFFRHIPTFVAAQFGYVWSPATSDLIVTACLILIGVSGYWTWLLKGGSYSYHESSLYHDLGTDTAGAYVVDHYTHRITAPAYIISQVFLAAPLQLLRCYTLLASRLPFDSALELRLENVLASIRLANKWQSLTENPDQRTEVLYLAQMGLIDFSTHKGLPRFKAN